MTSGWPGVWFCPLNNTNTSDLRLGFLFEWFSHQKYTEGQKPHISLPLSAVFSFESVDARVEPLVCSNSDHGGSAGFHWPSTGSKGEIQWNHCTRVTGLFMWTRHVFINSAKHFWLSGCEYIMYVVDSGMSANTCRESWIQPSTTPRSDWGLTTTFLRWEGSGVALPCFAKENLCVRAVYWRRQLVLMVTYLHSDWFGDIAPVNEVTSAPRTDNNASHWPSRTDVALKAGLPERM